MTEHRPLNSIFDSPVLALEGNILWQFENLSHFSAQKLKMLTGEGKLSSEIALDMSATMPKGPKVALNNFDVPEIHIELSHLELLWSFIYGWMVAYEESIQKPQLNPELVVDDDTKTLIDRAQKLLEWSASLQEVYSPWPEGLPSPRCYLNQREKWYGCKANLVFQKAVAYLLSHEQAHAALGHLDVILAAHDTSLRLDLEREADAAAYNELLRESLDDREKLSEAWALSSVMLSSFYLCRDSKNALLRNTHPALHHRLAHVIAQLGLTDPKCDYYFTFLCRLILQKVFPLALEPTRQFDDWNDALTDALDRLDQIGTA
jgi:hypothetical protein